MVPWAINAEIYPLRARTLGVSVAALGAWAGSVDPYEEPVMDIAPLPGAHALQRFAM